MDTPETPGFVLTPDAPKNLKFAVSTTDVDEKSLRARLRLSLPGGVSLLFDARVEGTEATVAVPPLSSVVLGDRLPSGTVQAVLEVVGERSYFEAWRGVARVKRPATVSAELLESSRAAKRAMEKLLVTENVSSVSAKKKTIPAPSSSVDVIASLMTGREV